MHFVNLALKDAMAWAISILMFVVDLFLEVKSRDQERNKHIKTFI